LRYFHYNADPNIQDEDKKTALIYAAEKSSPERWRSSEKTVEILLTIGKANPNIQDEYGNTALMYAVYNTDFGVSTSTEKTVQILLDNGADPTIKNNILRAFVPSSEKTYLFWEMNFE